MSVYPGVTILYSQPDGGRTSLAKRLALSAQRQGLTTFYYDVENKLTLHDPALFAGIGFASSYRESGLKELVENGLIDCIVVDTITGIHRGSHEPFIIRLKKKVPYIIVVTQMRTAIQYQKSVPAARDHVLSSAHTMIHLTNKEKIRVEGIDVLRVQYQYSKYEKDTSLEGKRNSFIIRNNIVDNLYSIYDRLRAKGLIHSMGKVKFFQDGDRNICLDTIKAAVTDRKAKELIIGLGLEDLKVKAPLEVYID